MVFRLALRNVGRNLRRVRPMIGTLIVAFALLVFANAVFERADHAFASAFVDHVSGEATVGEASDEPFTLFGSDALLVGEYMTPPTLSNPEELSASLAAAPQVADYTFVVTAAARAEVGDVRRNQFVFGVDFHDYSRFFPSLELLAGAIPEAGSQAVLLQPSVYEAFFDTDDFSAHLGEPVLFASSLTDSFVIREAPVAGVFAYPVDETLLDRVAIVDADTARALNGYVYGSVRSGPVTAEHEQLLSSDLDALFAEQKSDEAGDPGSATDGPSVLDNIDALFASPQTPEEPTVTDAASTAWNYALVRGNDRVSTRRLVRSLERLDGTTGSWEVRDWRASIGGNVLIVHYIRILVNVGILFVVLGASVITMNAIVLSVLERSREIGTMRAIGATKERVGTILSLETLMLVFGSALVGIGIGAAGVGLLNAAGLVVSNQYVEILFGGGAIAARLTPGLVLKHLGGGLVLTGLAVLYPLSKILRLTPLRAIAA